MAARPNEHAPREPHSVRQPAVAGLFYPGQAAECRAQARLLVAPAAEELARQDTEQCGWRGGVVPHAGWDYSGAIAGQVIATIARRPADVKLVVVFGAIHTPIWTDRAALDSFQKWSIPGEFCEAAHELRQRALEAREAFCIDDRFHQREHAVEVELPLIQAAWPQAAFLAVEVPPNEQAVEVGRTIARLLGGSHASAIFLASSDLTHYGARFGFAPAGPGAAGIEWAKSNDRRLIERVLKLEAEAIVPEVRARQSACGAGAIAAMLAACTELGASRAELLRHANSDEIIRAGDAFASPSDNTVGYAGIVVG